MKFLIFKSTRGLDRPWLVFTPKERLNPNEELWECGFATWEEAINSVKGCIEYEQTLSRDL
jgi:hypothetical protein